MNPELMIAQILMEGKPVIVPKFVQNLKDGDGIMVSLFFPYVLIYSCRIF
jgi:hypothetical protein